MRGILWMPLIGFLFGEKGDPDGPLSNYPSLRSLRRKKDLRGVQVTGGILWMPLIGFLFGEKGEPDGQCDLVKHTDCHSEQNGHPLGGRFAWESVFFAGKRIATPVHALARNDRLTANCSFRSRPVFIPPRSGGQAGPHTPAHDPRRTQSAAYPPASSAGWRWRYRGGR